MAQAVARTNERSFALVEYFETRKDQFAPLMEGGQEQVDKFMRVMKNAVLRDPQIAEASTQSVFLECQKCAADGLVLDGREAVLTRFKTKRGNEYVTEVVYVPMYRGLKKLAHRSPQIASWDTGLVYEAEYDGYDKEGRPRFEYEAGEAPKLIHRPILVGERGSVVIAYSVVRLRSGVVSYEVMTRGQLDRIKSRTKSKDQSGTIKGPWATDEEEMQRKTVGRRHFKNLPLEEKLTAAFERVDNLYDMPAEDIERLPETPRPKAVENKKKTSAKAKLASAKPAEPKAEETVDEETGEVLEGEIVDQDQGQAGFDADQDEF